MIPNQSTMCKDPGASEVQDVDSGEPGWVSVQKSSDESPKLLVWSTADEKGVTRLRETWESHFSPTSTMESQEPAFLNNLAYTLASRRTHHPWRTFVVSDSSNTWATIFEKFAPASQARVSPNMAMIFSGVCFLFPSQGNGADNNKARSAMVCDGSSTAGCVSCLPTEHRRSRQVSSIPGV